MFGYSLINRLFSLSQARTFWLAGPQLLKATTPKLSLSAACSNPPGASFSDVVSTKLFASSSSVSMVSFSESLNLIFLSLLFVANFMCRELLIVPLPFSFFTTYDLIVKSSETLPSTMTPFRFHFNDTWSCKTTSSPGRKWSLDRLPSFWANLSCLSFQAAMIVWWSIFFLMSSGK